MKRIVLIFLLIIVASCDKKSKIEKQIEEIPVSLTVERFDKIFYETQVEDFQKMKSEYPAFFPSQFPDSVFVSKMKDTLYRELYHEVQKKYSNFTPVQEELEEVFRRIKFYFPNQKLPSKVTTLISEMDYQNKVIYTDSLLLISLDLYLGKEHKFYEFPDYFRQTFQRSQIMPDVVSDFSTRVIAQPREKSFLDQMIYFGKEMYIKDLILPNYEDFDKIGYTKEQQIWCEENESEIWRYFIEDNILYDSDTKLIQRFIAPAPFSKFYLEIDAESPGRTGVWIGWQIVRSFMKNNEVSLDEFLAMDAKEIFARSKYKPKK
jgi:gliding motility-associated lipoprotein GldB